jgi:hypothetical protein
MGKQQETCGAVTGAIMVLGLLKGEDVNNNDELKGCCLRSCEGSDTVHFVTAEYKGTKCKLNS